MDVAPDPLLPWSSPPALMWWGEGGRSAVDRRQAVSGLLSRHSVGPRWLVDPGPSEQELQLALACARRAPDHGQLVPWRAVLIPTHARVDLGDLFARFARDVGKDEHEIEVERQRAFNGPVLVAWVASVVSGIAEVPLHEQWMTVGGALTNFLSALHLLGYGAKTLSGRKCGHPVVQDALCLQGESLVAFVCIGTASRSPKSRGHDDLGASWSVWQAAKRAQEPS